eukprot:TRINITY_DN59609_c0_g2_i1.p1 TRINITY_DN59609_c0_g2~~TRINITY_DN59609_c0_g2_i1.p1  ORF type:complete len:549 (-),score=94.64 TRINITY_DN59609_c0_g2_i1:149-1795(-)
MTASWDGCPLLRRRRCHVLFGVVAFGSGIRPAGGRSGFGPLPRTPDLPVLAEPSVQDHYGFLREYNEVPFKDFQRDGGPPVLRVTNLDDERFQQLVRDGVPFVVDDCMKDVDADAISKFECKDFAKRWPSGNMRAEYTPGQYHIYLKDPTWYSKLEPTRAHSEHMAKDKKIAGPYIWHVKDEEPLKTKRSVQKHWRTPYFLQRSLANRMEANESFEFWFSMADDNHDNLGAIPNRDGRRLRRRGVLPHHGEGTVPASCRLPRQIQQRRSAERCQLRQAVRCSNLGDRRAVLVFLKPVDPMAKPNGGLRARQTSAERNRDDKQSAGGAVVEKPEETGNPTLCGRLAGRRLSGSSVRASSKTDKRPSGSVPAPPKAQPMRLSWLSRDHKASCPHEKERIREAGGMVIDGRVEGLEPSRTLGDFDVKLQVRKNVISIVPEVRRQAIGDGIEPSQAVLVCATDGVWDILSGQDVCNIIGARKELGVLQSAALAEGLAGEQAAGCFVTPELRLHMKELAEDLVQFSIAKGSRDDCTAVCALVTAVPRCCIPRG